jgi:hypothetical protein
MDPAIEALLTGLIDYAGLFPPAKLDMATAVRNFLADRRGVHAFMLSRFICPAARLGELAPLLPPEESVPLSILAAGPGELPSLRSFLDAHAPRVSLGGLETKLPADPAAAGPSARAFASAVGEAGLPAVPMAFEASFPGDWRGPAALVTKALAAVPGAMLKVRCGGEKPAAFPTALQLACAVAACRDAGLPFKATAGLHHPVRGVRSDAGVTMHGFLNLFGGAVLAKVHRLADTRLAEILASEDRRTFWFRAGRFGWGGLSASAEEIARARAALATSFGSCSFAEPTADLAALGFLPGAAS